jgi:sugar lactone lactonase YvrE
MPSLRIRLFLLLLTFAAHANAATEYANPYYFTTFAGDSSEGSKDGTGNAARFWSPGALTTHPDGSLYVLDVENHTVRRISPTGAVTTILGELGSGIPYTEFGSPRFMTPSSLVIDASGTLYLADYNAIRRVGTDGTLTPFAGQSSSRVDTDGEGTLAQFSALRTVTMDRAGNFYAISSGAIRKITPAGVVSTLAGKFDEWAYVDGVGSAARFVVLTGLVCDAAGNLFAIDRGAHVIRKITPAGVVSTFAGQPTPIDQYLGTHADGSATAARFYLPEELAIDAQGNLYVGDIYTIRKVTPDGNVTTLAGSPGESGAADGVGAAARFARITGLTVAANGDLFVSDGYNNTVRRVTPAGAVITVAGASPADCTGTRDGAVTQARFSAQLAGIAIAASGNTYVADTGNHTIRKITPAGVVSTLAGQPGVAGHADGAGNAATFNAPWGVAVDAQENVYVTEPENYLVRKITPAGVVTTFAGLAGSPGNADGNGASARFWNPNGVAVDGAGNIYVTDVLPAITSGGYRDLTRRISPDGTVVTLGMVPAPQGSYLYSDYLGDSLAVDPAGFLYRFYRYGLARITQTGEATLLAGTAETRGLVDGVGADASFIFPSGLARDAAGNLYVNDAQTVRKVTPAGAVSTLAGSITAHGYADGIGRSARFHFNYWGSWIAADASGRVLVTTGSVIRRGEPALGPVITSQPQNATATVGGSVQFAVTATGTPAISYQWQFNGGAISGATGTTLTLANVGTANAGSYTVVVTNALGSATSNAAVLTLTTTPINPPSNPGGGGGSGGGGGAPSVWFLLALLAAGAARAGRSRRT